MTPVSDAVILMAGAGSRLRVGGHKVAKPLVPLLGRPLVSYTIEALARAGIKRVYGVVGFESASLIDAVQAICPAGIDLQFIDNPDWKKQNGISVLAAAKHLDAPFLLTMADHIFGQSIVDLLVRQPATDGIALAVDRKLDAIFDMSDAMKVQTHNDRVLAIGKHLQQYDAIDTGIFVCAPNVFRYLEMAKHDGDCSLADGVRAMAVEGKARAVDVGAAWWQDVDTPEMLAAAEKYLRSRLASDQPALAHAASPHGDGAEQ
jgi:1L-myo-inositol 1-phosphate cytidylyltransferase